MFVVKKNFYSYLSLALTQTAECLVIGEILCEKMIVVLNKVDQVDEKKREATVEKMKKRMAKTLENTRFKDCPIVAVAAKCGANEDESIGLTSLVDCIKSQSYIPKRDVAGPLMFSVDHCFTIKGILLTKIVFLLRFSWCFGVTPCLCSIYYQL